MSTLILVRHAQASFFEPEYDKLSPLGETQARGLGQMWATQELVPDEVYTGPRVRHRRTAELAAAAIQDRGYSWPPAGIVEAFDEHQVERLVREAVPRVSDAFPDLRPLAHAYEAAGTRTESLRTFQTLFEAVARLWCRGATEGLMAGLETWPAFKERTLRALRALLEPGGKRGRRIVVFTSTGPISVALQLALGCRDETALELGWRLRNASRTEFLFTGDRLTLDGFNRTLSPFGPPETTYR